MIQDLADDQLFSFEVNEDPSLIDDFELVVEVDLVDYSDDIEPLYISLPVSVICTDPELVEIWTTPADWEPTEYDQSLT